MTDVTPPNPPAITVDSIRREIAMLGSSVDAQIEAAKELTTEKFCRVDALMERAEDQRREQKADTKSAVDAALASQEAATMKMEKSITDQINSLRSNFETSIGSIQSSIADLKDRLTTLESLRQGSSQQRAETRQVTAGQMAAIGLAVSILLAVLAVLGYIAGGAAANGVT